MKEMYCITCPTGCRLSVDKQDGDISVQGNECNRGEEFAIAEMTNPMRTLTTTVRTTFPGVPVLPVRTDGEIPKGKIMDAMRALNRVVVSNEHDVGDAVVANIVGTGVRVIVTSDLLSRKEQKFKVQSPKPLALDDQEQEDVLEEESATQEEEDAASPTATEPEAKQKKGRSHIRRR